MRRLRDERGQSAVLAVLFLVVLLGATAVVLDVGSWFRAQRAAQATADASALAAAQALPFAPNTATSDAIAYAAKNGGTVVPADVQITDGAEPNDTVAVRVHHAVPGFFSAVFGIGSTQVGASATARNFKVGAARWAAPIVVNVDHPMLSGNGCPCFGPANQTSIPLGKQGVPGAFDMLNLDQSGHGTAGASTLADWIEHGFDGYLPLGPYNSDPGAKFNSAEVQAALQDRIGSDLLFPVRDTVGGGGAGATYNVIGWAAFHLTGFSAQGNSGELDGWFDQTIWDGVETTTGDSSQDFGVRGVELIQ